MSQTQAPFKPPLRAVLGETTRFEQDMPLDRDEKADLYTMIRSANRSLTNKNLRSIALLVATRAQAKFSASGKEPGDPEVDRFIRERLDKIFQHIQDIRYDSTNAVLYTPWDEKRLLEERFDFNNIVAKNLSKSLWQMAAQEQAVLKSGNYPHQPIYEVAISQAFAARNRFQDFRQVLVRTSVPQDDRSIDIDDARFELTDRHISFRVVQRGQIDQKTLREKWSKVAHEALEDYRLLGLETTARAQTLIDTFVWRSRCALHRRKTSDGEDVTFWNVMELGKRSFDYLYDAHANSFITEPLKELRDGLREDIMAVTGSSSHQIQVLAAEEKRKTEEEKIAYYAAAMTLDAKSRGLAEDDSPPKGASPEVLEAYDAYTSFLDSVQNDEQLECVPEGPAQLACLELELSFIAHRLTELYVEYLRLAYPHKIWGKDDD